jgi:hypothetical protein
LITIPEFSEQRVNEEIESSYRVKLNAAYEVYDNGGESVYLGPAGKGKTLKLTLPPQLIQKLKKEKSYQLRIAKLEVNGGGEEVLVDGWPAGPRVFGAWQFIDVTDINDIRVLPPKDYKKGNPISFRIEYCLSPPVKGDLKALRERWEEEWAQYFRQKRQAISFPNLFAFTLEN